MASIFSSLDPKLREAILQELLAQEEGSIEPRDPTLTERVSERRTEEKGRAVEKMRGLPTEEPGTWNMIQAVGEAAAEVARGLLPFYGSIQEKGTGGGVGIPGTGKEVRPAPAILDAIDTAMPGVKEVGFLIPALAKRAKKRAAELTPAGATLEAELREKAEQELTTPGQLADTIEEARHARESATGAQAGRMGLQQGQATHNELRRLDVAARREGIRGAAEDRITEDVMLDNLVDMLRSGEIPKVGPVKRGDIVDLLPRERFRITGADLEDTAGYQEEARRYAIAEGGQGPTTPPSTGGSVSADAIAAQRSLDAFVDDQLAMLNSGELTFDELVAGMSEEDASAFIDSLRRRGLRSADLERRIQEAINPQPTPAAQARQTPDSISRILGSLDHPETFRELSSIASAEDAAAIVDASYGYGNFDELGNLIEILPEESSGRVYLLREWMDYRSNILEGRASQPRRPARQGPRREEPE